MVVTKLLEESRMLTTLTWIPRGAARSRPARFEVNPEEYERILALANQEKEDNDVDISDLPAELQMDKYDEEDEVQMDDDDNEDRLELMEIGGAAMALDADSDGEDMEDDEVKPTDSLVVVALTEDEYSHLEVHLLSEEGDLYVHHDIVLPEFPLCLAWMDCPPYQQQADQLQVGNYIAVGTFDPAIEIWNLDVLDPLEPSAVLGGISHTTKKVSKKTQKKKTVPVYKEGSHSAAVMGLSWNRVYRQALASGSADNTVKIWDVTTQACSHTFTHHTDKVQSVAWHPTEAWQLASGSFDKTVSLVDCRNGGVSATFALPSDIESLAWDPVCCSHHLYCALEDGLVVCLDSRMIGVNVQPVFTFQAHEETTSSVSFSSSVPGLLATSSIDKTVRLWDVKDASATNPPRGIAYKTMNVGKLFCLQFSASDPYVLATGGDKGMLAIWESDEQEVIRNHFEPRMEKASGGIIDTVEVLTKVENMQVSEGKKNKSEKKKNKK